MATIKWRGVCAIKEINCAVQVIPEMLRHKAEKHQGMSQLYKRNVHQLHVATFHQSPGQTKSLWSISLCNIRNNDERLKKSVVC